MSISAITNNALSGMMAQTTRVAAAANNVANADTPGYQRLNTSLSSLGGSGGVTASVSPSDGDVDMGSELTDMMMAEQSYKANASVFETGADMWDVLMSIKRD